MQSISNAVGFPELNGTEITIREWGVWGESDIHHSASAVELAQQKIYFPYVSQIHNVLSVCLYEMETQRSSPWTGKESISATLVVLLRVVALACFVPISFQKITH